MKHLMLFYFLLTQELTDVKRYMQSSWSKAEIAKCPRHFPGIGEESNGQFRKAKIQILHELLSVLLMDSI